MIHNRLKRSRHGLCESGFISERRGSNLLDLHKLLSQRIYVIMGLLEISLSILLLMLGHSLHLLLQGRDFLLALSYENITLLLDELTENLCHLRETSLEFELVYIFHARIDSSNILQFVQFEQLKQSTVVILQKTHLSVVIQKNFDTSFLKRFSRGLVKIVRDTIGLIRKEIVKLSKVFRCALACEPLISQTRTIRLCGSEKRILKLLMIELQMLHDSDTMRLLLITAEIVLRITQKRQHGHDLEHSSVCLFEVHKTSYAWKILGLDDTHDTKNLLTSLEKFLRLCGYGSVYSMIMNKTEHRVHNVLLTDIPKIVLELSQTECGDAVFRSLTLLQSTIIDRKKESTHVLTKNLVTLPTMYKLFQLLRTIFLLDRRKYLFLQISLKHFLYALVDTLTTLSSSTTLHGLY